MVEQIKILTVSDLHQSEPLYRELQKQVETHKPDLVAVVGDFLDGMNDEKNLDLTGEQCAERLACLPCSEVVLVRGNHEDQGWLRFQEAWRRTCRPLHALHGEALQFGPLVLVGFPCLLGDATFYQLERPLESAIAFFQQLRIVP